MTGKLLAQTGFMVFFKGIRILVRAHSRVNRHVESDRLQIVGGEQVTSVKSLQKVLIPV